MKLSKYSTLGLLFVLGLHSLADAAETRPNLLLIVTDEHNFRTLGCYREQMTPEQAEMWGPGVVVETPHLDFMAKHGTMFTSMYGSSPVCMPSRASMFTGMYPHTLGIPNNSTRPGDGKYLKPEVTTIAEVGKRNENVHD